MQRELNLLASLSSEMKLLPSEWIAGCSSEQAAFRLCLQHDKCHRTQESMASALDVGVTQFKRMINADYHKTLMHMPRVVQINLQRLCGNRAIDQWADLYERGMLNCQRERRDRKAELLAELAALENEETSTNRRVG